MDSKNRHTKILYTMVGLNMGVLMAIGFGVMAEDSELDAGPRVIPYNGYLEFNGEPFTGPADIRFTLTDDNGCDFPEAHEDVQVFAGQFSVGLGTVAGDLPTCLFDAEQVFLQMAVRGGAEETDHIPLAGRQSINPVPFAYWAAEGSDFKVDGQVVADSATINGPTIVNGATQLNGATNVTGNLTATGQVEGSHVRAFGTGDRFVTAYSNTSQRASLQMLSLGIVDWQMSAGAGGDPGLSWHVNGIQRMRLETNGDLNVPELVGLSRINRGGGAFSTGGNLSVGGALSAGSGLISGATGQTAQLNIQGNNSFGQIDAASSLTMGMPGHIFFELGVGQPDAEFSMSFHRTRANRALIMTLNENGQLNPFGGIATNSDITTNASLIANGFFRYPRRASAGFDCNANNVGWAFLETQRQNDTHHVICVCMKAFGNNEYRWMQANDLGQCNL